MNRIFATKTPDITPQEQAHMDRVRALAGECMVLLENNGVLPLKTVGKLALYGSGARGTVKGGTGSGDVNSRFVVTIEQGLEAAGFTITTKGWLDRQETLAQAEKDAFLVHLQERAEREHSNLLILSMAERLIPQAMEPITPELAAATDTDTAVYVLARNSGEGTDRSDIPGDYQLLPAEAEQLTVLGQCYKNVIVLLNVGGVVNASAILAIPGISALMLVSQSGNIGGYAVADVLTGKTIPSGRLTDTWAANYEDYPSSAEFSHNNGNCNDEYYNEGIYVGYRYFDTFNVTPLYPFGYGLGYTGFAMEPLDVTVQGETVSVAVKVTNIGDTCPGKEVVQIYASAPAGTLEKPYQVLAAFGKTRTLQPGEEQVLTVSFPLTNLESYDPAKAAYVLEGGTYYIRVGRHSRATKVAAALTLGETVVTKQVKNICPLDEPFEELSSAGVAPWSYPAEAAEKAAAKVIALDAAQIPTQTVTYQGIPAPLTPPETDHVITMEDVRSGAYTMEQLVAQLTVEEMADLCVGTARDAGSVIGSAAQGVPGAAGDTSTLLAYRGVRRMTNADGPAGLRLTPHFRTDAEGNLLPGGEMFGDLVSQLPPCQPGEVDYYQYCTAIPIASLLASSWDLELVEAMGDIVGAELEQFGVQIWLAPGMNIHRNPLCGRNFEYYSEDPLLSGLCAAADVKGVQKHPGIGTSIKHFCVNNQEDNRMFVNEHVGERALREIYLRNFGVAIEASQPMTIMTSYNLLNGVHAANCYDTITCYAREECGFAGYVMTDWYTSHEQISIAFSALPGRKYGCSSSPMCVYAGNDVQMPGCEKNISDLVDAVADGSLPLGLLQGCCVRLLNTDLACSCFEDAGPFGAGLPLKTFVAVEG
ncbi:MAG: glycoside hydrolase family 3 C-terminal domain-containing protein [Clostridiales bacterium]|nr:glycoside hydrolase family 3 C-terminal domain-containing protein [Clostridiales bacterium]